MLETQMSEIDECSRPRLRSRVKTDRPSASSTISSSDSLETRPALKKQKAGRPIAYKGDPDSKALTETERRKIKRRIANRESARRVRAKRAGTLEELQIEMDHLTERNSSLLRHVAEAEGANAAVKSQLQQFHQKLRHVQGDNSLLQQQTAFLQKQQQQQKFIKDTLFCHLRVLPLRLFSLLSHSLLWVLGSMSMHRLVTPHTCLVACLEASAVTHKSCSLMGYCLALVRQVHSTCLGKTWLASAELTLNCIAVDKCCLWVCDLRAYLDNFDSQQGQSLVFT